MTERPDFHSPLAWTSRVPTTATILAIRNCSRSAPPLGRRLGLTRIGIHHERLLPRTPHVLPARRKRRGGVRLHPRGPSGRLDRRHAPTGSDPAMPSDFHPARGICHSVLNNTTTEVRLLVVGERPKPEKQGALPAQSRLRANPGRCLDRCDATPRSAVTTAGRELGAAEGGIGVWLRCRIALAAWSVRPRPSKAVAAQVENFDSDPEIPH